MSNIFDLYLFRESEDITQCAVRHVIDGAVANDTRTVYKRLFNASLLLSFQQRCQKLTDQDTKRVMLSILKHAVHMYKNGGAMWDALPKLAQALKNTKTKEYVVQYVDEILKRHENDNVRQKVLKAAHAYSQEDKTIDDVIEMMV